MSDYIVTRTYNDDGSAPNTAIAHRNFVPAQPVQRAVHPAAQLIKDAAQSALAQVAQSEVDGAALSAMRTVSESSTPVQRAMGLGFIILCMAVVVAVLSFAMYMAGASARQAWALFAVLCIVVAGCIVWLDYAHTPIAGERRKARLFVRLEEHRIDAHKEVDLAKVDAFLELARMAYGPNDNDTHAG